MAANQTSASMRKMSASSTRLGSTKRTSVRTPRAFSMNSCPKLSLSPDTSVLPSTPIVLRLVCQFLLYFRQSNFEFITMCYVVKILLHGKLIIAAILLAFISE